MPVLLRYVWSDALRSHGWVAPLLTYAGFEALLCTQTGSVLPTYAWLAVVLLFVSTWLAVVTVNSEDPIQADMTLVSVGSLTRVRVAKLAVAWFASAALILAGLVGPIISTSSSVSASSVVIGATAQLLTALTGVALGGLLSRPIVTKRSWAVLVGAGVCLATIVIPYGPPARQLLVLLNKPASYQLGPVVALVAIETLVLTALGVIVSVRLSRQRI